jgi:hypothetical protein
MYAGGCMSTDMVIEAQTMNSRSMVIGVAAWAFGPAAGAVPADWVVT